MTVTEVGAYEARTHFARLLEQVESGDEVVITKHGRAVARLVPEAPGVVRMAALVDDVRRLRESVDGPQFAADEIRELIGRDEH